jgi:hypothetical protein
MTRTSDSLPERFPVGTKYVVESRGSVVSRYLEFPNGRRVILAQRKALPCAGISHRSGAETRPRKSKDQREGLRATAAF